MDKVAAGREGRVDSTRDTAGDGDILLISRQDDDGVRLRLAGGSGGPVEIQAKLDGDCADLDTEERVPEDLGKPL